MIKAEIKHTILPGEFDGLCVSVMKDANRYKLYISRDLLGENGLLIWQWQDRDYYTNFLDENIESFIEGIGNGFYRKFSDGYWIDRKVV